MKILRRILTLIPLLIACVTLRAQQTDGERQPSLEESCENEADRLQTVLGLDDWQTFYVDSTLKHDYKAMQEEYQKLQKQKVSSYNIYQAVQDKWMDKIDDSFKSLFTDEQWAAYLKQGAARQQKARAKRREKAAKQL